MIIRNLMPGVILKFESVSGKVKQYFHSYSFWNEQTKQTNKQTNKNKTFVMPRIKNCKLIELFSDHFFHCSGRNVSFASLKISRPLIHK